MIPHRIVAEISKNWTNQSDIELGLLSQRFEKVIAVNQGKGFQLESWQMNTVHIPSNGGIEQAIIETIVAVFVKA